jgi:hypothetical protein
MIQEVVREELRQLFSPFLLKQRERVDESADDQLLLQEALAVLEEYGDKPEAWMKWEDFEAELDTNHLKRNSDANR